MGISLPSPRARAPCRAAAPVCSERGHTSERGRRRRGRALWRVVPSRVARVRTGATTSILGATWYRDMRSLAISTALSKPRLPNQARCVSDQRHREYRACACESESALTPPSAQSRTWRSRATSTCAGCGGGGDCKQESKCELGVGDK